MKVIPETKFNIYYFIINLKTNPKLSSVPSIVLLKCQSYYWFCWWKHGGENNITRSFGSLVWKL